jgi:hypothetical protein
MAEVKERRKGEGGKKERKEGEKDKEEIGSNGRGERGTEPKNKIAP